MKPLDGYGVTVTFDGSTLVVTPANKSTVFALLGQHHKERVLVLHRTQVVGVQCHPPSALTNGKITLTTSVVQRIGHCNWVATYRTVPARTELFKGRATCGPAGNELRACA